MGQLRGPAFVLALVGALALGTGIAYWIGGSERGTSSATSEDGSDADGVDATRTGTDAREPASESALRRETAAGTVERGASPAAREYARGELTGRVLDAKLRPLAGAAVVLSLAEAREFEGLDAGLEREGVPAAQAETGADGTFRFALQRGLPVDVTASLPGYSDALQPDAYAGQELELVLAPGVRVFGTVTRARDGAPVAGARVRAFRVGGSSSLERATTTRADGGYELRIPFRADAALEVVPSELQASEWIDLAIGPDDVCRQDVALEAGVTVHGRVTASDTGAPLPGAVVGEGWWFRRTATADARGEYRLPGFGAAAVRELAARATGYGVAHASAPAPDEDGTLHLDFALEPGRALRGRVVDESGAPVGGAYVAAVASEFAGGAQRTDWLSTRTDLEGRYRITDLARALGHALLVAANGYGTQVHDCPESELETSELELPDIVLRRPALLAGHVEDPSQTPLADVEIELEGWNHDRFRFSQGTTPRARHFVDTRRARTDARGRFWFGDLSAGRYRLVTRAVGRPESAPLELELVTGERREDLLVRLDSGGTIRGQVQDEHGAALAGVHVSAQGERLADPAARPVGGVNVRTRDDGQFELEGLPAGEYTLRAYPLETPNAVPAEPWMAATVEHVATGAQPIRIELRRGASIRGRVLDAAGAPLAGYVVASVGRDGNPEEYAQTDAAGRFTLGVPRGSSWTLEVRGAPEGESFRTVFLRKTGVAAGTQDLELRLAR